VKKIILQAGHFGRTSGSTGAPGEADFNWDVCNRVSSELQKYLEVKIVKADPIVAEIKGDWDCFLAIHYDADIYGKGGYFVDFADPSIDGATRESQRIAGILNEAYGTETGIVCHPERSNVNTRKYYMWSKLSAKTPCVLIECGVGQHKPDDYEVLFNQREKVVKGIVKGILKAFSINYKEESMDYDTKKAIELLTVYKNENGHGNLEGAISALVGESKELSGLKDGLAQKDKEIKSLQDQITSSKKVLKDLEDRVAELETKYSEKEKSEKEWRSQLKTANQTIENQNKELEYHKPYKQRYEDKNKEYNDAIKNSLQGTTVANLVKELLRRLKIKK
jgi:hypothetical protein